MEVHVIDYSHARFDVLSENERKFLLMSGHVQNEVTFLNNYLTWSIGPAVYQDWRKSIAGCQALFAAKLMAGKINEALLAMDTFYFAGVRRDGQISLDDKTANSLRVLAAYKNSGDSICRKIRNNFAFHYADAVPYIAATWSELRREPDFVALVGENFSSSFHLAAEFAANLALLNSVDADRGAALNAILTDVQGVAKTLVEFLEGASYVVLTRHFPDLSAIASAVKVDALQEYGEINIPFFCKFDSGNFEVAVSRS